MFLLELRLKPFPPDRPEAYLRPSLVVEIPRGSLLRWPMKTPSAYLRKETTNPSTCLEPPTEGYFTKAAGT